MATHAADTREHASLGISVNTDSLSGSALDWAVQLACGMPHRAAVPATNADLEGTLLPITFYEVVSVSDENNDFIDARVEPITIVRFGIRADWGATAPSISAVSSRGEKFTGSARDYYVTREEAEIECARIKALVMAGTSPSTDWSDGGPIVERENISLLRCEDVSIPDTEGFWQGKYEPRWAAVTGQRHDTSETYGSHGNSCGLAYEVDADAVTGPTPLVAAMRCYVKGKLGDKLEIPPELISGH